MLQQPVQLSHCCLFWLPQLLHTCCHNIHLQCEIIILLMLSDNTQTIHSSSSTLTLQRLQGTAFAQCYTFLRKLVHFCLQIATVCQSAIATANCFKLDDMSKVTIKAVCGAWGKVFSALTQSGPPVQASNMQAHQTVTGSSLFCSWLS